MNDLLTDLLSLRPQFAAAAQAVIDDWTGDGDDPELGSGGCCDRVTQAMMHVASTNLSDVSLDDGGQEGDDHDWLVVTRGAESCGVDIPADLYERGGGYNWRKRDGVLIQPSDVVIWKL